MIYETLTQSLLIFAVAYYLLTNLQWYNYNIKRVILHHHKRLWHLYYLVLPIAFFLISPMFVAFYVSALYFWYKGLDKPLVFTKRVKKAFGFIVAFALVELTLCQSCLLISVVLGLAASHYYEAWLFKSFQNKAKVKLNGILNLKIVAITASYGKTSTKNFLAQILSPDFKVYFTPKSVNTIAGIVQDINNNLPLDTQIYIVEAGARLKGDINEIAQFINPHYALVGKIGPQHLEYFKTIENIKSTKYEILNSNRLEKSFLFDSEDGIQNLVGDLNGIAFDLEIEGQIHHFTSPLLGKFNALNITMAIHCALAFGLEIESIKHKVSNLRGVEHRLAKSEAGGKIIIDDSYNSNFDGMSEAIELCSTYTGRKVIITPGLVEASDELNIKLAKMMNDAFDMVIITGSLNKSLFDTYIEKPIKIILTDKTELVATLASQTKAGDLILFANDAPSYI